MKKDKAVKAVKKEKEGGLMKKEKPKTTNQFSYELTFVFPVGLEKKEADSLAGEVEKEISKGGGLVKEKISWGEKVLAYKIGEHQQGSYFIWKTSFSEPPQLGKINLFLEREKKIIRYLWVKAKKTASGKVKEKKEKTKEKKV